MSRIGILGAGTWGIALARMLTNCEHEVTVWSALPDEIDELSLSRRQKNLPGMIIPDKTKFTKSIECVCTNKDLLLFAVPSIFVRSTSRLAASYITDGQIIVDVAKGIESGSLYTMTEIIRDELEKAGKKCPLVALSGPTHAEEVARDLPTMIVAACENLEVAQMVQEIFMNARFRVYTNPDVKGVELCGCIKNIIALATGIATGLGCGDNTKAALITRGMAEITRLGKAMGCNEQTFSGLAGMGDLIVTATSEHSRNNRCGKMIGQGISPQEAIKAVGMVVEGINAIPATLQLAKKYQVSMPITEAVNEIINFGGNPEHKLTDLMNRERKAEISL